MTYTRALKPTTTVAFGNMNGFFAIGTVSSALLCTLWNPDENDTTVRTFSIPSGFAASNGVIPLAVKQIDGTQAQLDKLVVVGI